MRTYFSNWQTGRLPNVTAGKSVGESLRAIEDANRTPAEVAADERQTEKAFMADVVKYARDHGWRTMHILDSRKSDAVSAIVRGKKWKPSSRKGLR